MKRKICRSIDYEMNRYQFEIMAFIEKWWIIE